MISSMSGICSQLEGVLHSSTTPQVGTYNCFFKIFITSCSGICLFISVITHSNAYFQDSSGVTFLWKIFIMSYAGIHLFFSVITIPIFKTVVEPRFEVVCSKERISRHSHIN